MSEQSDSELHHLRHLLRDLRAAALRAALPGQDGHRVSTPRRRGPQVRGDSDNTARVQNDLTLKVTHGHVTGMIPTPGRQQPETVSLAHLCKMLHFLQTSYDEALSACGSSRSIIWCQGPVH